jgi:hypothetical protein
VRVPLLGFMPDVDPETPGAVIDCDAIVPTQQGLAAANALASAGMPTLAATPTSGYATELLDGTRRLFVGTAAKIYEATGMTWTDRSRAGDYTGAQRKRFTTFGNVVLEGNKSEVIGGRFAASENLGGGVRLRHGAGHQRRHLRRPARRLVVLRLA